jgi:hypothetical protein
MNNDGDANEKDNEQFVPVADYNHIKDEFLDMQEQKLKLSEERDQLREALKQIRQGIHKASDGYINGNLSVRVESWRRCREIGMDLLHIPIGGDNVELILKLDNGYLRGITQKPK